MLCGGVEEIREIDLCGEPEHTVFSRHQLIGIQTLSLNICLSIMASYADLQSQGASSCFIKQYVLPFLTIVSPDCIDLDNT